MNPNLNFKPMSTTMQCILNLTLQYFVIYTALGITRTVLDFQGKDHKQSDMAIPLKEVEVEETGEIKADSKGNPFESPLLQGIFNAIRYLTVIALYVGFGAVLVGLFKFTPDPAIWDGEVPPISPAVGCTVMLSTAFFLIYFLLAVSRTYSQYIAGTNTHTTFFQHTMERAAETLGMAPMLCALFLGARMRALQMNPVTGNPQRWAQNCFWLCSSALLCQTCVAVLVPYLLSGEVKKGRLEGDAEYVVGSSESWLAKGFTAFRFCIMLFVYACA